MIGEVVCCDAMQYMKTMPDESVDLVILDPDYNEWQKFLSKGIIQESMRIMKPTGNLLCFTKQPFDNDLRNAIDPWFRREIVWSFTNGGAWVSNKMPLVSHQKIYWCVKSKDFFFNPRTGVAYSESTRNFKRANKVFGDWEEDGKEFTMSKDGVWLRDHLHYNKPNSGKIPAKPKELVEILIRCFSPQGGVVYDAFLGSGIITSVADTMNREVYACEIDEDRCIAYIDQTMRGTIDGIQHSITR